MTIEFTVQEAKVLQRIIQNHNPSVEDEMLALMIYNRIARKIEETTGKNEST